MNSIVFIVEKTNTGFSAYAEDYPVYTTGNTITELKLNILDAINTWFDHKGLPDVSDIQVKLQFDLPQVQDVELIS